MPFFSNPLFEKCFNFISHLHFALLCELKDVIVRVNTSRGSVSFQTTTSECVYDSNSKKKKNLIAVSIINVYNQGTLAAADPLPCDSHIVTSSLSR